MPIRKVVALISPGVQPFEFGVACEAWGTDRSEDGLPVFDFMVASSTPGPVATSAGFSITADHRLDVALDADLVIAPASGLGPFPAEILDVVATAHARGAQVLSLCSGAFVLGAAGLLDGRRCTTHWRYTTELGRRHPTAEIDADVLYVSDGRVHTSAGSAAGLDMCLHMMRTEFGSEVANKLARRMVVPPHRAGGQAQYIELPVSPTGSAGLAELMDALLLELDREHTVDSMAKRVHMTPRTFARRFNQATGTTPHAWLLRQRVLFARRQLESTHDSIETIAAQTGFGTAALLRHHFQRHTAVSPTAYRRAFSAAHS